jgi:hypothetical protein
LTFAWAKRAVAAAACVLAAISAQAETSAFGRPIVLAQAGFTFGSRDDLGPRYDPYSERYGRDRSSDSETCCWVPVRRRLSGGEVVLRQQRLCGFKVPARQ